MFRNLAIEKVNEGEFRVSFVTDQPSMVHFIKFFRLAAKEAEFFFTKTLQAVRSAELSNRRRDPSKEESARWERKNILRKYNELKGKRRERIRSLRHLLISEGKPLSYDGLYAVLQIAWEEDRKEKAEKIEQLVRQGVPYRAIARGFGKSANSVIALAKSIGVHGDRSALEDNLVSTVQRLAQEGLRLKKISRQLGVPLSLVRCAAKRAGLSESLFLDPTQEEQAAQVAILAEQGLSFREIARRLNISEAAVYRRAKRMGTPTQTMRRTLTLTNEIAELAAQGLSSRAIASRFRIPEAVLRTHPSFARGTHPGGSGAAVVTPAEEEARNPEGGAEPC